jgi:alpha-galactosidase
MMTVLALAQLLHAAPAVSATPEEMAAASQWVTEHLGGEGQAVPPTPFFSFTYDGKPSSEFLSTWEFERAQRDLDAQRVEHTLTWRDPKTGLQVKCVAIQYRDFPTVEWTLYFKNTGSEDTPIIEAIQAIDTEFTRGGEGEFTLHHHNGDGLEAHSYEPLETALGPNASHRFVPNGGRPTNGAWPYFNLEWPGGGVIAVVGWPGQWAAEFTRDEGQGLRMRAGQELTHFTLHPGEKIRTPLLVLQFHNGDWVRAQNIWRRWMMSHSMPRPGGELPPMAVRASSSRAYMEMTQADEASQIMFIDRYLEEKLPLDYWWMDAGWYPCNGNWPTVGTWEVDKERFPNGFKPISDHAHAKGVDILVWFEPERVAPGTWLTENHPEWIHGGANGGLLNLGIPEAREWLTDHVDTLINEQDIDLYRQDFNMDPLSFWRGNDAADRQGITEIRHVEGYLAYWDELLRRHPDMLIDACASGGRRLDLETLRRAIPLWRSDYVFISTGMQCLTYGLSFWVPHHGTGTVGCENPGYYGAGFTPVEPYAFWSHAAPSISCGFDMRIPDLDYEALRDLFAKWQRLAPNYYGDFFPLTAHSTANDVWIAWQFNRPETGEGAVQVFRRGESPYESARLPLMGLDPGARYVITNLDTSVPNEMTGAELMEKGLPISLETKPAAAVLLYRRANQQIE